MTTHVRSYYTLYSTMRLWDVNDEGKKQRYVLKTRSKTGHRVIPTACTYSHDGRWVVAACNDGSIQIWDHNKSFVCDVLKFIDIKNGP